MNVTREQANQVIYAITTRTFKKLWLRWDITSRFYNNLHWLLIISQSEIIVADLRQFVFVAVARCQKDALQNECSCNCAIRRYLFQAGNNRKKKERKRREKENKNKTNINKIEKIKLFLNLAGIILKPMKLLKWCSVRKLDGPFLWCHFVKNEVSRYWFLK